MNKAQKTPKFFTQTALVLWVAIACALEVLLVSQLIYTLQLSNTKLPTAVGEVSKIELLKTKDPSSRGGPSNLAEEYKITMLPGQIEYSWRFSYHDENKEEVIYKLLQHLDSKEDWISTIGDIEFCTASCNFIPIYESQKGKVVTITYDPQANDNVYNILGLRLATGEDLWISDQDIKADFWVQFFLSLFVGGSIFLVPYTIWKYSKR